LNLLLLLVLMQGNAFASAPTASIGGRLGTARRACRDGQSEDHRAGE